MMTKEQMIDSVIRVRGFEDRWTIWFCELAEVLTESQLLNAFIILESGCVDNIEEEWIDEFFDNLGLTNN